MSDMAAGDLLRQLIPVAGERRARRMLRDAARLARVSRQTGALAGDDLLRVCAALSAEGGLVQQIAEEIARASLRPDSSR